MKGKTDPSVNPESTIESSMDRDAVPNRISDAYPNSRAKGRDSVKHLACESTIESANRRSFIRKAAIATAAVGIGSTVIGDRFLPNASAKSNSPNKTDCCSCHITGSLTICNVGSKSCSGPPYNPTLSVLNYRVTCSPACDSAIGVCAFTEGTRFPTGCPPCCFIGPHQPTAVAGRAWDHVGVQGWSNSGIGVIGSTHAHIVEPSSFKSLMPNGAGVYGLACSTGCGVFGNSPFGHGINGKSCTAAAIFGISPDIGVHGCSPSSTGVLGTGKVYGVKGCTNTGCAVYGNSCSGHGVFGHSKKEAGVYGTSCCSPGVRGCSSTDTGVLGEGKLYGVNGISTSGCAVYGHSCSGHGVYGHSKTLAAVYGSSCTGPGVRGCSISLISVLGSAAGPGAVPLVARGASAQTANLQQWQKNCGGSLSVVSKCGWLALGATCAPTTLHVAGSVSAKTVITSSNYAMGSSDFAVLASGAVTVTLPKASTAAGMLVFIKNTSTSTVTLSASGTDTIEGAASKSLTKQYDSLQLISNGTNQWFLVGNSICDAFTS
jgi:hypothetical protein